jgi:hypothetical protein
VKQPADSPAARAAAVALLAFLTALPSHAEEWHEAYRAGLAALARGDHARAAEALQRAIAARPEPGRNVVTYGTNVEPRYFPYLRLAEAQLGMGRLPAARQALAQSAAWAREPADEREKLAARLEAAEAPQRPPAPSPVVAATPTSAPPTPEPVATAAPEAPPVAGSPVAPAPAVPLVEGSGTPGPPRPQTPGSSETRPRAAPSERFPQPAATPLPAATGALEVLSKPPGASAYVDDEPVGSTDPQSGRLVKSGLAAGSHRVRVTHAGHEEIASEIMVPAGGSATFYATLRPVPEAASGSGAGYIAVAALALALVAVLAWAALRRPAEGPVSIGAPTPLSLGTLSRAALEMPAVPLSPGARRDAAGQEWFGDFRLLGLLGRGGMASVFKAERRSELSALKRPLGSFLEDTAFLERFRREAEIGRTLNHPNIVRILERGDVEGVPYFTMELLPGETLHAKIRAWGASEPPAAVRIVAQVAEALDYAHSKGVIHRDLKPSNVMLLQDGTVKVMDFGIARARRFDGLTATGAFLGTPDYLAPEAIEGRGAEPRSDLYALGVIFFELLTGRRPFTADTPYALLKKHCSEEPPRPSQIQAGLPPELEAIVLGLLAKDPSRRPADAEGLVVALRDWLNRAA